VKGVGLQSGPRKKMLYKERINRRVLPQSTLILATEGKGSLKTTERKGRERRKPSGRRDTRKDVIFGKTREVVVDLRAGAAEARGPSKKTARNFGPKSSERKAVSDTTVSCRQRNAITRAHPAVTDNY